MKQRTIIVMLVVLAALFAVLRSAGDLQYWGRHVGALSAGDAQLHAADIEPRLVVAGEPRGMPRAPAIELGIAEEAMDAALAQARKDGARALIVHRRGHEAAAYYGAEGTAETLLAGGDLSPALLAVAVGTLVDAGSLGAEEALAGLDAFTSPASGNWRNPWSAAARARFALRPAPQISPRINMPLSQFVSERMWRPLGAHDAAFWGSDAQHLRVDCCVLARPGDWARLGDLLLQQGQFEGEHIVSADWMRQLLAAPAAGEPMRLRWMNHAAPFTGDEPPATRDAFGVDLSEGARLWLVPQRQLVVLHWAGTDGTAASDTTLLNIVIRGIVDLPVTPPGETAIGDLVPAH